MSTSLGTKGSPGSKRPSTRSAPARWVLAGAFASALDCVRDRGGNCGLEELTLSWRSFPSTGPPPILQQGDPATHSVAHISGASGYYSLAFSSGSARPAGGKRLILAESRTRSRTDQQRVPVLELLAGRSEGRNLRAADVRPVPRQPTRVGAALVRCCCHLSAADFLSAELGFAYPSSPPMFP